MKLNKRVGFISSNGSLLSKEKRRIILMRFRKRSTLSLEKYVEKSLMVKTETEFISSAQK